MTVLLSIHGVRSTRQSPGGLLAGVVVATSGYGTLNAAAAVLTLPVIALVASGRRVAAEV